MTSLTRGQYIAIVAAATVTWDAQLWLLCALSQVREFVSDFGPIMVITGMAAFCGLPKWRGLLSFLEVRQLVTQEGSHRGRQLGPLFFIARSAHTTSEFSSWRPWRHTWGRQVSGIQGVAPAIVGKTARAVHSYEQLSGNVTLLG